MQTFKEHLTEIQSINEGKGGEFYADQLEELKSKDYFVEAKSWHTPMSEIRTGEKSKKFVESKMLDVQKVVTDLKAMEKEFQSKLNQATKQIKADLRKSLEASSVKPFMKSIKGSNQKEDMRDSLIRKFGRREGQASDLIYSYLYNDIN